MFATAESIINSAKDAFISENFNIAFSSLRDCFDSEDVSDETLMDMFCGRIGVSIDGNNVEFGKEIPVDPEYKEDVDAVLLEYRCLYEDKNYGLLTVTGFIDLQIGGFVPAEDNQGLRELMEAKGTIIPASDSKLARAGIKRTGEYIYVSEKGIYFLSQNSKTLFIGISEKQNTIEDAVNIYKQIMMY